MTIPQSMWLGVIDRWCERMTKCINAEEGLVYQPLPAKDLRRVVQMLPSPWNPCTRIWTSQLAGQSATKASATDLLNPPICIKRNTLVVHRHCLITIPLPPKRTPAISETMKSGTLQSISMPLTQNHSKGDIMLYSFQQDIKVIVQFHTLKHNPKLNCT